MTLRIEYRDIAPGTVQALSGLNAYSDSCAIAEGLRRLIEIRVSQINSCRYCVVVHRHQALAVGESEERVRALEAWQDSALFTDAERAALAWAESVTRIAESQAPEDEYQALRDHFGEKEIIDLTFIALAMNAWNRLAIAFRREPLESAHDGV